MMPPLTGPDLTVLCIFFLTALVSGIAVVLLAAGVLGSLFLLDVRVNAGDRKPLSGSDQKKRPIT